MEKIANMKGTLAVKTYLREIEGLGDFICIFKENTVGIGEGKYFVDKYFEAKHTGIAKYIIGSPVKDIDEEIKKYETYEETKIFDIFDREDIEILCDAVRGNVYNKEIKPKNILVKILSEKNLSYHLDKVILLSDSESEILFNELYLFWKRINNIK